MPALTQWLESVPQADSCWIGRFRAAQLRQGRAVKGMQRLTRFEHHQIGDIDHVVDRPDPSLFKPPAQPHRRRGYLDTLECRETEESSVFKGTFLRVGDR